MSRLASLKNHPQTMAQQAGVVYVLWDILPPSSKVPFAAGELRYWAGGGCSISWFALLQRRRARTGNFEICRIPVWQTRGIS